MPNHVINILSFDGTDEEVKTILEAIRPNKTENGSPNIDFNKIIPMPEELNIESSTGVDRGLEAYAEYISEFLKLGKINRTFYSFHTLETKARKSKKISEKDWELGKKALINLVKYGSQDWYDWCCENWGTKWNAYGDGYIEYLNSSSDDGEIIFSTAWAEPEPVIAELSKQYPDVIITHSFANEDIGAGCGQRIYSGGGTVYEKILEGEEAMYFACDLWGYDVNEYKEEIGLL